MLQWRLLPAACSIIERAEPEAPLVPGLGWRDRVLERQRRCVRLRRPKDGTAGVASPAVLNPQA